MFPYEVVSLLEWLIFRVRKRKRIYSYLLRSRTQPRKETTSPHPRRCTATTTNQSRRLTIDQYAINKPVKPLGLGNLQFTPKEEIYTI
jgi:hypothetical protein